MLLLELIKVLPFLITCFILVALAGSIRILIKFHDHREFVDGTEKTFFQLSETTRAACQLHKI